MPTWLADVPLERTGLLATVYAVVGLLLLWLALPFGGVGRRHALRFASTGAAALLGGLAGAGAVAWADATDAFGVALSAVVHLAFAGIGAGIGVAVANVVRTRWWRVLIAAGAIPAVLLAGGLLVNEDFAYFPTLGDAVGVTGVGALALGRAGHDVALSRWRPPAGMPAAGHLGTVVIPATESHFHARDAYVYLPPAARVPDPPRLPVLIALSGEPGTPDDVFAAGRLATTMNAIARTHHGVAPIVVVPDQLGSFTANPMCVDSRLGNVATYITHDVRTWILKHLPVQAGRQGWTIGGFSEGGTCSMQFGAGYPAVFGSIIDVSGEVAPRNGSTADTIAAAFHGDAARYHRESPLGLLHGHRFPRTRAVFAAGADDARYSRSTRIVSTAAAKAGMRVTTLEVPGGGHEWHMAGQALAWGVHQLLPWWGIR